MCDFDTNCNVEDVLWVVAFPGAPVSDGKTLWVCRDHIRDAASMAVEAWRLEACYGGNSQETREHAKRQYDHYRSLAQIIPETDYQKGAARIFA